MIYFLDAVDRMGYHEAMIVTGDLNPSHGKANSIPIPQPSMLLGYKNASDSKQLFQDANPNPGVRLAQLW